ncbi:MAG: helix-turn-helix transcriptional regulator [Alphaproteobacteria bacterium]|nr:helix-turn-helix transcriptional regulator [Alphaproteobacteria bacterium]
MSVSLSKTKKKIHRQVQAEDLVLAGNIRTLREQQNLTQQDMSKSLGVSFQQFQKYENGKNRISASRIIEISRLLNTTPNFLLGWSSEMTVSEKTNQNVLSLWRSIHSKSLQRILMLLVKEINQFKQ